MLLENKKNEIDTPALLIDLEAMERNIKKMDLPVKIVSAGGTGTYFISGANPKIKEIQAGSYVFMDARYSATDGLQEFEQAL